MKSPPDPSQFRLPKKTPKADVSRNSSVYFAVGLVLMLFVSYQSINYKSYDKTDIDIGSLDLEKERLSAQIEYLHRVDGQASVRLVDAIEKKIIDNNK